MRLTIKKPYNPKVDCKTMLIYNNLCPLPINLTYTFLSKNRNEEEPVEDVVEAVTDRIGFYALRILREP